MTKVVVVNGPNLGRLGVRQPDVYGKQDLETLRKLCTEWGHELGLDVEGASKRRRGRDDSLDASGRGREKRRS